MKQPLAASDQIEIAVTDICLFVCLFTALCRVAKSQALVPHCEVSEILKMCTKLKLCAPPASVLGWYRYLGMVKPKSETRNAISVY